MPGARPVLDVPAGAAPPTHVTPSYATPPPTPPTSWEEATVRPA